MGVPGYPYTVATDGSCLTPRTGGAIGWAWYAEDGKKAYGGAPVGTNQVAELVALAEALECHPGVPYLVLQSDSQYALNCATRWRKGWEAKGLRTAGNKPISNKGHVLRLWAALDARTRAGHTTTLQWVKGHAGHALNTRADELAKAAARLQVPGAQTVVGPPRKYTQPSGGRKRRRRAV